jgi:hypothetical protein
MSYSTNSRVAPIEAFVFDPSGSSKMMARIWRG